MDAANTMDISVVIPLYNKENSIRTAVEAVLRHLCRQGAYHSR